MELCILELRKAIIAYEECEFKGYDTKNALLKLQRRCIDLEECAKRHLTNSLLK